MNREQRRASKREGARVQKLDWNTFRELSAPELALCSPTFRATRNRYSKVWQNHKYFVFLIKRDREFMGIWWDRVMCRRSDSEPICSWPDMQRIKNELFGEEVEAIQFLPKQSELIDSANLYWFFIKSEGSHE